jgi:hypothetical protein
MEKNQNAIGTTLWPARSLEIHCEEARGERQLSDQTGREPEIELRDEHRQR